MIDSLFKFTDAEMKVIIQYDQKNHVLVLLSVICFI